MDIIKVKYEYPELDEFSVSVNTNKIEHIEKVVCEYYGVTMDKVKSSSRAKHDGTIHARHMIFFLAHNNTKLSVKYLGFRIGKRHHTTCLNGVTTIKDFLSINDYKTTTDYEAIKALLPFQAKDYRPRRILAVQFQAA